MTHENDGYRRDQPDPGTKGRCRMKWRYAVAFVAMLANLSCMSVRTSLSVAIIAMVNQSAVHRVDTIASREDQCETDVTPQNDSRPATQKDGEFAWDQATQGLILGSFFYGYVAVQMPAGWLSTRLSNKWIGGLGILVNGLTSLLIPLALATRAGVALLVALRVLQGLGMGALMPSFMGILARWSPPMERTTIVSLGLTGLLVGPVITLPVTGLLCEFGFAGGWPSVFYVFGTLTTLCFVLWCVVVYDMPDKHPFISNYERTYIDQSQGTPLLSETSCRMSIPWRALLTSVPFWAALVTQTCNDWGYYTMTVSSPQFLSDILRYNITQNGLLSALPQVVGTLLCMIASVMADVVRRRGCMSTTNVRKSITVSVLLVCGTTLVMLGHSGCERLLALVLFTISMAVQGMQSAGFAANYADLSPRHAGFMYGIANSIAALGGIGGPYLVGYLTNNQPTIGQWRQVFYITAGINGLGAVVYLLFCSGEKQPWDDPHYSAQPSARLAHPGPLRKLLLPSTLNPATVQTLPDANNGAAVA